MLPDLRGCVGVSCLSAEITPYLSKLVNEIGDEEQFQTKQRYLT
jgi:hypothetical protein